MLKVIGSLAVASHLVQAELVEKSNLRRKLDAPPYLTFFPAIATATGTAPSAAGRMLFDDGHEQDLMKQASTHYRKLFSSGMDDEDMGHVIKSDDAFYRKLFDAEDDVASGSSDGPNGDGPSLNVAFNVLRAPSTSARRRLKSFLKNVVNVNRFFAQPTSSRRQLSWGFLKNVVNTDKNAELDNKSARRLFATGTPDGANLNVVFNYEGGRAESMSK